MFVAFVKLKDGSEFSRLPTLCCNPEKKNPLLDSHVTRHARVVMLWSRCHSVSDGLVQQERFSDVSEGTKAGQFTHIRRFSVDQTRARDDRHRTTAELVACCSYRVVNE